MFTTDPETGRYLSLGDAAVGYLRYRNFQFWSTMHFSALSTLGAGEVAVTSVSAASAFVCPFSLFLTAPAAIGIGVTARAADRSRHRMQQNRANKGELREFLKQELGEESFRQIKQKNLRYSKKHLEVLREIFLEKGLLRDAEDIEKHIRQEFGETQQEDSSRLPLLPSMDGLRV